MRPYCTICKWYKEKASDECRKKHFQNKKRG
jgi:hypothetical protein